MAAISKADFISIVDSILATQDEKEMERRWNAPESAAAIAKIALEFGMGADCEGDFGQAVLPLCNPSAFEKHLQSEKGGKKVPEKKSRSSRLNLYR